MFLYDSFVLPDFWNQKLPFPVFRKGFKDGFPGLCVDHCQLVFPSLAFKAFGRETCYPLEAFQPGHLHPVFRLPVSKPLALSAKHYPAVFRDIRDNGPDYKLVVLVVSLGVRAVGGAVENVGERVGQERSLLGVFLPMVYALDFGGGRVKGDSPSASNLVSNYPVWAFDKILVEQYPFFQRVEH